MCAIFKHLFLLHVLWALLPHCSAVVGFSPCALKNNEIPFYYDPSVQSQTSQITGPIESCPSCKNAFYFASATFNTPFNGAVINSPAEISDPANGFVRILTCPNWCACTVDGFCVSNLDTAYGALYPYCSSPTSCAMYLYSYASGQTPAHILSGTNVRTLPVSFPPGNPSGVSFNPTSRGHQFTTASCDGCDFAIDCITATTPTPPASCFSADTTFQYFGGAHGRMDEMRLGDWVLAASTASSSVDSTNPTKTETIHSEFPQHLEQQHSTESSFVWSRVEAWLHRVPDLEAEFHRIELADGRAVKLTAKHFVYRAQPGDYGCPGSPYQLANHGVEGNNPTMSSNISITGQLGTPMGALLTTSEVLANGGSGPVFAEDVRVGDCLFSLAQQEGVDRVGFISMPVVGVTLVRERGIYAPLTGEGNILVDGVLASCYTLFHTPTLHRDVIKTARDWWPVDTLLGMAGFRENRVVDPSGFARTVLDLVEYIVPTLASPMYFV